MLIKHKKLTARLIPRVYLAVDLDNLCLGCRNVTPEMVALTARNLIAGLAGAGIDLNNLMVAVAFGAEVKYRDPASLFSWPNSPRPRLLQGHGINGADERLLDVLNNDPALRRSRSVVIASGDHIYSAAIDDLNGLGIETTVACHSGSLSAKLKIACKSNIDTPELSSVEGDWIA